MEVMANQEKQMLRSKYHGTYHLTDEMKQALSGLAETARYRLVSSVCCTCRMVVFGYPADLCTLRLRSGVGSISSWRTARLLTTAASLSRMGRLRLSQGGSD